MANTQLQQLIKNGLAAMKTGGEMAARDTAEINNAAHNSKLKEMLEKGNATSKKWTDRIQAALQEAGDGVQRSNPVIEGISKVNQEILKSAPDDYSRDLGIIAGGQLALHYWIAAFGTMQNYADEAGLKQTSKDMQACVSEAKDADTEMTKVAEEIMNEA